MSHDHTQESCCCCHMQEPDIQHEKVQEHAQEHLHGHDEQGGCCCHSHKHTSDANGRLGGYLPEAVSLVMLVTGMVLTQQSILSSWHALVYYLVAIAPVAILIVRDGWDVWRAGDFMNEFTLMLLAAVGAMAIGEYPEAVAILLFYSAGEKLMQSASDDVRRRVRSLINKMPREVTIECPHSGNRMGRAPEAVKVGDTLVVKPGERIALDGVLLGDIVVDMDTSALTGESVPRPYAPGSEVSAGVIPVGREVRLRVSRAYSDSTMSRMMRMIEEAARTKTPTETMLRRVTRWFTPTVIMLALLVMVVPFIVSLIQGTQYDALMWFRRALVFFVCSCPCALVVSIPLSYFATLGSAARRGLLFKGASHIDAMRLVDTVVLDKTGTVTTGRFAVVGTTSDEVLAVAAAVDAGSAHPLAEAIVAEASARGLTLPAVDDVETVSHGMRATMDGKSVLVGSRKLLETNGVSGVSAAAEHHGSEICVAIGGVYVGSITLEDTVKAEAADAIKILHRLGVADVKILSGDREAAVSHVAAVVGADSYSATLLPADKYSAVSDLKAAGRKVAFVGDGINDAPSIAAAHVGIAMGTLGTDMAMESADVVIAADRLDKLAEGISLSRRARNVVIENVTFAFAVKGTVMALAAAGIATLWAGVFADTGVTLITILWALLRLRK